MRLIGAAERGIHLMIQRAISRRAFDKLIAEHGSFLSELAKVSLLVLPLECNAVTSSLIYLHEFSGPNRPKHD